MKVYIITKSIDETKRKLFKIRVKRNIWRELLECYSGAEATWYASKQKAEMVYDEGNAYE